MEKVSWKSRNPVDVEIESQIAKRREERRKCRMKREGVFHAAARLKLCSSAADKSRFCKRILFGVVHIPVVFHTLGARREISNRKIL